MRYNGQVAMLVTKSSCTVASIFASNHLGGTPERDTAKWPADVQELAITPKAESLSTPHHAHAPSPPLPTQSFSQPSPPRAVIGVSEGDGGRRLV